MPPPFCRISGYSFGFADYFTVTLTVAFFLPHFTVILQVPFFFAVITPLLFTAATLFLLEE